MTFQGLVIQIVCGISFGMVMFLIAVGLSLIFGTLGILNMAHGAFYMIGAYLCFWLLSQLGHFEIQGAFWIAILIAPILVAAVGGIIETVLLRRIYSRDFMEQYLLTVALIMIIGDVCKWLWGVEYHLIPTPWPLKGVIPLADGVMPIYNLFLIVCGIMVFAGLWLLVNRTRLGSIIRAVTYNREMASALGINVKLVYTSVFMLGCWLAGLGGVLISPISAVMPGMDMVILIECFVIIVIGGLGSFGGAFLGALLFGLVNAFGIVVAPGLDIAFGFILMIIILLFRPWGLLGQPE